MWENRTGVIMLRDETEVHGEKPISMSLRPPQLKYGMTWGRTRFSSMTSQCLITRTKSRLVCLFVQQCGFDKPIPRKPPPIPNIEAYKIPHLQSQFPPNPAPN